MPVKVCVPLDNTKPPVPLITPANVSLAADKVKVFVPKTTEPAPESVVIVAPEVVALISNVAAFETPLEVPIEPLPLKAKVPEVIVVMPV